MVTYDITTELAALTRRLHAYRIFRMDRLTEKLRIAAMIVPNAAGAIERDADALIARGGVLSEKRLAVFARHHAVLDTASAGLDGLEDQLALLSNDPLGS